MADSVKTITSVPGWVEMLTSDGVPDSVAALYKRVPILFRAIQLRCDALSSVPVNIYKGEENGLSGLTRPSWASCCGGGKHRAFYPARHSANW